MKKNIKLALLLLCVLSSNLVKAQQVYSLYPGKTPGMENANYKEVTMKMWGNNFLLNVSKPTLTVYLPEKSKATGAAVVILPGGAHISLSIDQEGNKPAKWLQEHGVAAIVLKYRLIHLDGKTDKEVIKSYKEAGAGIFTKGEKTLTLGMGDKVLPTIYAQADDSRAAMKFVRKHASEWGIDQNRVGIMGFSAGASNALATAINHDADSKPNFSGIIYGAWLSAHAGEKRPFTVPTDAAPMFIASPEKDLFEPDQILCFYKAWREKNIPAELHSFPYTEHGFSFRPFHKNVDKWLDLFYGFMHDCGAIPTEKK